MKAHPFLLVAAAFALVVFSGPARAQTVYVSRMWHNHQPIYWPEWNTNGSQTSRIEYAGDSMALKPFRSYGGSTARHPENNLSDIFGLDDRRNAYQSRPKDSLANIGSSAGFCLSYSGSLIDNIRQLGGGNQLGYGSGWWDGNRTAKNWTTPHGNRRLDLVGFTYHHSLAPLLPKAVLRKEIQTFKQAWWKAWGGQSNLSDHSKGFFPTEMAFSTSMVDVLADEGYQWSIVASHHLSRTCPTYFDRFDLADNSYGIFSSPPNRADLLGPSPAAGWWYGQPNPGNAAWNVAPFAYQLHRVKHINPETGAEKSLIIVPSDDVLSYRYGYADEGVSKIEEQIAPFANDPDRPVIVMPSTDGDNAWGGGFSSWMEATPAFFNNSSNKGYAPTAIQDLVDRKPPPAGQFVHIEDGSWIFPESCYGSPYFLKWIEPPVAASAATRYPGTVVDMESPGFALKFWSWAPVVTGANWCETAEQILRDEGGDVQAWKIQAPYDWDGAWTSPNDVELAWHIYLGGLDSGFNYYGGLGNDDEVKAALATTRAIQKLQPWMTAPRRANDRTPPTVLKPQRFPHNPGGYTFGWFNSIPGGDTRYLKKMPTEFYVWTHAYDISGISSVQLKVRVDHDGVNSPASNHNETYAGGSDTGAWVSLPMTRRALPNSQTALNAAANNGQINYFITPPELADYYFARISSANLPGFEGKLLDYFTEATDNLGNVARSEIQHVFVEGTGTPPPPQIPANTTATPTGGGGITVDWDDCAGATDYIVTRDGADIGSTGTSVWFDTGLTPATSYTYSIRARYGLVESGPGAPATATTAGRNPDGSVPFAMDGVADHDGYRIASPGMTIYAALRGTTLYVSTWAPGAAGNDHFVFVGTAALANADTAAPWMKAGRTALPAGTPFLAAESTNAYIGWFQANGAAATSARGMPSQQMEGTIDLAAAFPIVPADLYLAALAYQTADGGILGAQAPAGNADGDVDANELLRMPLEVLRDEDANGVFDRLEPGKGFVISEVVRSAAGISLTWTTFPGKSYRIESSPDMTAGSWTSVPGSATTAGPTETSITTDVPLDAAVPRQFFRVAVDP